MRPKDKSKGREDIAGSRSEQSSVNTLRQVSLRNGKSFSGSQAVVSQEVDQMRVWEWWERVRPSESVSRVERLKPEMENSLQLHLSHG